MTRHLDEITLTSYALGELDPAERAAVEQALADDPEAAALVQELQALASLAQDALLKAWRKRASFDGRSDVRTWIIAISRNHWLDCVRRKRCRPTTEPMTDGDAAIDSAWPDAAAPRDS